MTRRHNPYDITVTQAIVMITAHLILLHFGRVGGAWVVEHAFDGYLEYLEPHLGLFNPNELSDDNPQNKGFLAAMQAAELPESPAGEALDLSDWRIAVILEPARLRVFQVGDRFTFDDELFYPSVDHAAPLVDIALVDGVVPDEHLHGLQLIDPLYDVFSDHSIRMDMVDSVFVEQDDPDATPRARAKPKLTYMLPSDRAFEGHILFAIHPDVPFSTRRQVWFTAGQTWLGKFRFLVRADGELRILPSILPKIGPPGSKGMNTLVF